MGWSCGVVVITSALHAEGPRFDPEQDHVSFFFLFFSPFFSLLFFLLPLKAEASQKRPEPVFGTSFAISRNTTVSKEGSLRKTHRFEVGGTAEPFGLSTSHEN